jgi:uncharacterized repeat protein (TIGR02543 family)
MRACYSTWMSKLSWMLALVLAGCGGSQPAALSVDDAEAVFNTVENAPFSERTFTFTNVGDANTAQLAAQLTGDLSAFSVASTTCDRTVLAGGERCNVTVRLASNEPGSFAGEVRVVGGFAAASALLSGRVVPASLELLAVGPTTAVAVQGKKADVEFTLTNVGGAPSGAVHVASSSLPFDLGGDCQGATLAGGASCHISLTKSVDKSAPVGPVTGSIDVIAVPGGEQQASAQLDVLPALALSVSDATWSGVPTLVPATQIVTVSSPPEAQLTTPLSVKIDNGSDGVTFDLAADECSGRILAPGGSCNLTVRAVLTAVAPTPRTLTVSATNINPGHGTLNATGVRAHWSLTIMAAGTGSGRIYDGAQLVTPGGKYLVRNGTTLTSLFTASADANSSFIGWAGPCNGTGSCTNITATDNQDLVLYASFNKTN